MGKTQVAKSKKTAVNKCRIKARKAKTQAGYTEANKLVKKSIKTDKRKYLEHLVKTKEKPTGEGIMKELYDKPRSLQGYMLNQNDQSRKQKANKLLTEQMRRGVLRALP